MSTRRSPGEGSISKRKDGRFVGTIDLGIVNGKRKRKYIYGKTRREVLEKLKHTHTEPIEISVIASDTITVSQFMIQWLEVIKHTYRPCSYECYSSRVRNHINPYIGMYALSELTARHIQELLSILIQEGLASSSVRQVRTVISRALQVAMRWELIDRNVALLTDAPRLIRYKAIPLSLEQTQILLDAVKGHRLEALFRLVLTLGLRRGEALGLCKRDIDFEHEVIRIENTLLRVGGRLVLGPLKTDASRRVLPLPPMLALSLKAHLEHQNGAQKQSDFVFTTSKGTPFEPRNIGHEFKRILERAGLPSTIRFHDLRHSMATLLIRRKVDIKTVMELLGHTSIQTTLMVYAHSLPESQREAIQTLDDLWKE